MTRIVIRELSPRERKLRRFKTNGNGLKAFMRHARRTYMEVFLKTERTSEEEQWLKSIDSFCYIMKG